MVPLLGVEDIVQGRLPAFVLPYFLHEATHHTCLNSPVGLAMTVLENRTRALAATGSESDLFEARRFNLRSRAFLDLYRPLFEGLAMFAEFDATPGAARIASTPTLLALDLFARDAAERAVTTDKAFEQLFGLITRERAKADIFGRKQRLLSEPLSSRDGYLIGYLLVKCFGTWAALTNRLFEDSDFTLSYAIHHFFHDYELVDQLLQPVVFEGREILTLMDHLATRLDSLFSKDSLPDQGARFEDAALAYQSTPVPLERAVLPLDPVHSDPAISERARTVLVEGLEALPDELQTQVARRSLLHLTSIPVIVEFHDESFVATFENRLLLRGESLQQRSGIERLSGSVDVFYETATYTQGLAVSIDGELISRSFNRRNDELVAWLEQFVVAREHVVQAADLANERLDAALADDGWVETRAELIASLRPRRDEMYQHYGLLWVPLERRPDFVQAARRNGFHDVVGPALVPPLAMLALLDGLGAYLEDVHPQEPTATSLEDGFVMIEERLTSAFDGTPLHLDFVEEDGEEYTRIRAFV